MDQTVNNILEALNLMKKKRNTCPTSLVLVKITLLNLVPREKKYNLAYKEGIDQNNLLGDTKVKIQLVANL